MSKSSSILLQKKYISMAEEDKARYNREIEEYQKLNPEE